MPERITTPDKGIGFVRFGLMIIFTAAVLASLGACSKSDGQNIKPKPKQSDKKRTQVKELPVPVAIHKAWIGSIARYYSATATLEAEKQAQILSRVTGIIESLHCEEGDEVKEGQELLKINNDEYSFLLMQAEAKAASLRDRYKRLQDMWKQKLVSAEEFQTLQNDLKSAEAAEDLARLNLSYTSVKAPFSGRIVSRLVDIGQNANVGTPLFVIADFHPLLARVHVPSKEFKRIKLDQPVDLVLDSNKIHLKGKIRLVSPIIDPNSGTIKITIEIPKYPPDTRPGDFAEVHILTEKRDSVVLVPKVAIFSDRGEKVVFVASDSTAERRVVDVGFEDEENAEILSGVSPGEPVIVKGQRSLKHGSPIKILSAGIQNRRREQAGR